MTNDDRLIVNTLTGTRLKSKIVNPLVLILLLFTALTLYNSVTLPLGEADDETDHYQYLRFVAHAGHPPFTEAQRDKAGFKGGLAPLYYWLTAWPITAVGPTAPPDIRPVNARPERHLPTDGLGINRVLHTLDEQWPWRGQPLAWHLVRLLSLPMGWVTIIATYALARRLLPYRAGVAVGAAAFIAFLPRFVGSSAVINDDNLVFALTALLLLVQVKILQGDTRRRTLALLGGLFGLALVTKYFSLILAPEIVLTLALVRRQICGPATTLASPPAREMKNVGAGQCPAPTETLNSTDHGKSRNYYPALIAFLAALAAVAGPWFIFIAIRFNRVAELGLIPGLAAGLGEPQITEGLVGLLAGQSVRPPAATYALPAWLGLLYRSFWFEYGWMQLFAPAWVYGLFTVIVLLAGVGLAQFIRAARRQISAVTALLGLHVALFLIVVIARYILSATIDTGQGRHLFPALPVIAVAVALGLAQFQWRGSRALLPAACYLGLAAASLLLPLFMVRPAYFTLPVTTTPPANLPITHRLDLPLAPGLQLAGLDAPDTVEAGAVLPVTLVWHARTEAAQDYLLSLCLQDSRQRPVACRRGHFADGRYPARAWETGDTLIDTVYIPIPVCPTLTVDQPYTLRLEAWPLRPNLPQPVPADAPALAHTFDRPRIAINPGPNPVRQADLWRGNTRLTGPVSVAPDQALTLLTYPGLAPADTTFATRSDTGEPWPALSQFTTPLHLPCAGSAQPAAVVSSFVAGPALPPGRYTLAGVSLDFTPRQRAFAPVTSTLTFGGALAPLTVSLPGQSPLTHLQSPGPIPFTLTPSAFALPVTVRWQARRIMADPLVVSLKLLDRDYAVGGERVAALGDRYPNVLWVPKEIIEETYPVQLKPDAPPGLYRLELSVVRQDNTLPGGFEYLPLTGEGAAEGHNLYPLTVRLPDPAQNTPPPVLLAAQVGQSIELRGYGLTPPLPSRQLPLNLALYWHTAAALPADYTVFTQLIGPDGQVWAQWDNPPQAGRYPTTAWAAGDTVVDRYTLTLREGAPPGQYRLLAGMYNPQTGQRLPVRVGGQPQPDNALELARLMME
jgi:hypothetical protein